VETIVGGKQNVEVSKHCAISNNEIKSWIAAGAEQSICASLAYGHFRDLMLRGLLSVVGREIK
jgi:hypothetical protein